MTLDSGRIYIQFSCGRIKRRGGKSHQQNMRLSNE